MNKYEDLTGVINLGVPFELKPKAFNRKRYLERTDRNIGWITRREQELLRLSTVGIAGCGGMGGLLAATLLRAGIGRIKIADLENFDLSNVNRQFAANQDSLGKSKAIQTATMLRGIADDSTIIVYPNGINEDSCLSFVEDCDLIADEIEFWAVGARLLLHRSIGQRNTIFNGNSVGMGTRLFKFTTRSAWKMEDILGLPYAEAVEIESKIRGKTASAAEVQSIQKKVLKGLVPEIPEYMNEKKRYSNQEVLRRRLFEEGKASILATNPPMATGFLANHIILEILRKKSPAKRDVIYAPEMPGYLFFDAALMKAKVVQQIWWT